MWTAGTFFCSLHNPPSGTPASPGAFTVVPGGTGGMRVPSPVLCTILRRGRILPLGRKWSLVAQTSCWCSILQSVLSSLWLTYHWGDYDGNWVGNWHTGAFFCYMYLHPLKTATGTGAYTPVVGVVVIGETGEMLALFTTILIFIPRGLVLPMGRSGTWRNKQAGGAFYYFLNYYVSWTELTHGAWSL